MGRGLCYPGVLAGLSVPCLSVLDCACEGRGGGEEGKEGKGRKEDDHVRTLTLHIQGALRTGTSDKLDKKEED